VASSGLIGALLPWITRDSRLESLSLAGYVPPTQFSPIAAALARNSHVRRIRIQGRPWTYLGVGAQAGAATAEEVAVALHNAMTADGSLCVLEAFEYPPMGSAIGLEPETVPLWAHVCDRLKANGTRRSAA
jgi:hypothetical protein